MKPLKAHQQEFKKIPHKDYFDLIFDEDEQASEELTTARAWVFSPKFMLSQALLREL